MGRLINFIFLNVNKCQAGKSIIYNINTEDSTTIFGGGAKITSNITAHNIYHKYTDPFGKIKSISFLMNSWDNNISSKMKELFDKERITHVYSGAIYEEPKYEIRDFVVNFVNEYPSSTEENFINKISNSPININNLAILKETNEELNISLQINFAEENSDTILFDKFVELNALINKSNIVGNDKDFAILVLDKDSYIDESDCDLCKNNNNGTLYNISLITQETNNCLSFELESEIELDINSKVVLCQRIYEDIDGGIKSILHLYSLISKNVSEKIKIKKIYLEFFTPNE